jgi:hypothetical protein
MGSCALSLGVVAVVVLARRDVRALAALFEHEFEVVVVLGHPRHRAEMRYAQTPDLLDVADLTLVFESFALKFAPPHDVTAWLPIRRRVAANGQARHPTSHM